MVEHTAVNRGVVGSSPTRGAGNPVALVLQDFFRKNDVFRSCWNEKSNYINMYGCCNMYSMFVWIW